MKEQLGNNIKLYREARAMSASELARRAGISKGYLYSVENGETESPSVFIVDRIAQVFNVSIYELLGKEIVTVEDLRISPLEGRIVELIHNQQYPAALQAIAKHMEEANK